MSAKGVRRSSRKTTVYKTTTTQITREIYGASRFMKRGLMGFYRLFSISFEFFSAFKLFPPLIHLAQA